MPLSKTAGTVSGGGTKGKYTKRRTYRRSSYRRRYNPRPYTGRRYYKRSYSKYTKAMAASNSYAVMLVDPFLAANKGVKIPDADSTASVAFTLQKSTIMSFTDPDAGTNGVAAIRVYPAPYYREEIPAAGEVTGGVVDANVNWATAAKTFDQWSAIDGQMARIRLVNYGVKVSYIGNRDTDAGQLTYQLYPTGESQGGPLRPDGLSTYRKTERLGSANTMIVGRKVSNQAYDYFNVPDTTTLATLAEWSEFIQNFETITIWGEATNVNAKLLIEMVWNFEAIPGAASVAAGMASKPAYHNPKILDRAHRIEHAVDPVKIGITLGTAVGGMYGMPAIGGFLGGVAGSAF